VAGGWLGRWFGGDPPPAHLAEALASLDKLAQQKPTLAPACAVFAEVLPALFTVPVVETPPTLNPELAREKLASGIPLLRGEPVALDARSLRNRWLAICAALGRQNPDAPAVAGAFTALDPAALLAEVLAGRPEAVQARAETLHLDAALTGTVLRLAAFPVLARFTEALDGVRDVASWQAGSCPTCGSWPLLAELRGLEMNRYLRCGLCAGDWAFPRLRCPFCDNHDHRQLGFFHVDGEESRRRASTCDACRGYVKTTFTLAALSAPQLLVTDLATLHLDLAAADRGYFVDPFPGITPGSP
jgi:FdhE protein